MKVLVTEYLRIDLDSEQWECRVCGHVHGSARENYKKFMLIHDRNPQEIHRPILDTKKYPKYNFSPDPGVCVIYEFYCRCCGTMIETEYTVPGHLPLHDIELDIDALKRQWASRDEVTTGGTGADSTPSAAPCGHRH
jgi:acetone carboxylase gamma subunit